MNVLISGATSFIASYLVDELLKKDEVDSLYLICRRSVPKWEGIDKVHIVISDMSEYHQLRNKISEPIHIIFSFAWSGVRGASRNETDKQYHNYKNTVDLIKAFDDGSLENVFLAGSQEEYGVIDSIDPINEEMECHPVTMYGKYKLRTYEELTTYAQTRFKVFDLRFVSIFGVGDYENSLISYCFKNMMENKEVQVSSCKNIWNYLYVKDGANILSKMILLKDIKPGIYNICSNDNRELKSYVETMRKVLNSKSIIIYGDSKGYDLKFSNSKIVNATNTVSDFPFVEAIEDMKKIHCE